MISPTANRFALLLLVAGLLTGVPGAVALPPIPPPANAWAARNLHVLDKDPSGVFINANSLYVESLRQTFPEIQNVAGLIGKTDFDVYPADLAAKFRADDQRVLAGGQPFTTVEVNQPVGGTRTIVRVTKIPLRGATNQILGLRAIWHTHPQLETRLTPGALEVSLPASADIFRLEMSGNPADPASWTPRAFSSLVTGGNLTVREPLASPAAYFRLAAARPVKIGAMVSLTGSTSSRGQGHRAALKMALEEVSLEQQSAGSPVTFTLDLRDTTHTPARAFAQFQEFAAAGVKIVIGPQSSAEMLACKEFADAHDILLISPSSTASSLAFARDNLLRFCPDDTYEAAAIVALLRADGITAIVPVWRQDAGNQGLRDSTVRIFGEQGGVVHAGSSYPPGETNFARVVAEAAASVTTASLAHPGKVAVCLAGFDEVVTLFKVARTNDTLSSVKWYGGDGLVQSQLLAADPEAARFAAERGYPCPIFGLDERYRQTWEPLATRIKFESGHNEDVFTLAAYDAFRVAVQAYRQAGDEASFATVKAAFESSANAHIGATGSTVLNTAGDRDGGAFDFWSLKPSTNGYVWYRSASFQPSPGGSGTIIRH